MANSGDDDSSHDRRVVSAFPIEVIPVIDILRGEVVRGVGGRRSEYRPVVSRITSSTVPVDVARAMLAMVEASDLYVADLDALGGQMPSFDFYRELSALGARVWVDAGVTHSLLARQLVDANVDCVAGLETIGSPDDLRQIIDTIGVDRLVFSLDLRGGAPLRHWGDQSSPIELIDTVMGLGIKRLILLDLARVGMQSGAGTEELCRAVRNAYPAATIVGGGGVRGMDDLRRLREAGASAALVASAIHDGVLSSARPR